MVFTGSLHRLFRQLFLIKSLVSRPLLQVVNQFVVIPSQSTTDYHLIVTPKVSTLSMKKLKEKNGIKENGKPGKLQSVVSCLIDIYVLDPYLFTININDSFKKSLQRDQLLLSSTARALSTLQEKDF